MTHFRETAPELWSRAFRVPRSEGSADRFCERLDAEWGFLRRKAEGNRKRAVIEGAIGDPIRVDPTPREWARSPELRDAAACLLRLRQTLAGLRPKPESGTWEQLSRREQSRAAKDLRRYLTPFVESPGVRIARRREVSRWVQLMVLGLSGGRTLLSFSDSGDGVRSRHDNRDARLTWGVQLILAVFVYLGLPTARALRAVARDLKADRPWIRRARKCMAKQGREQRGAVADLLSGLSKRTRWVSHDILRDVLTRFPDAPSGLLECAGTKEQRRPSSRTRGTRCARRTDCALLPRGTAIHYVEALDEPCRTGRFLSDGTERGQTKRFAHLEYALFPHNESPPRTMRETTRAYNSLGCPETWHLIGACCRRNVEAREPEPDANGQHV